MLQLITNNQCGIVMMILKKDTNTLGWVLLGNQYRHQLHLVVHVCNCIVLYTIDILINSKMVDTTYIIVKQVYNIFNMSHRVRVGFSMFCRNCSTNFVYFLVFRLVRQNLMYRGYSGIVRF